MNIKKYKISENNIMYDIEESYFGKYWRLNGVQHRECGPAVELNNGTKHWYKNGQLHRIDGPAVELSNGIKQYWYNYKYLEHINSDKELKRYIKLLSIS